MKGNHDENRLIPTNIINSIISKYYSNNDKNIQLENEIINYLDLIGSYIPNSLLNFNSLSIIGSGSFGKVLSGYHNLDKNIYAIKCIEISSNKRENILEKTNEIILLAKLSHPNIIRYYNSWIEYSNNKSKLSINYTDNSINSNAINDFNNFNGEYQDKLKVFLFIQMEKMTFNLKEYLDIKKDNFSIKTIISQIIEGVIYLHTNNIVHCDIKPDNILINDDKKLTLKLTDFGLATIIGYSSINYKYYGTYEYSPPEMIESNYKPDYSTDIYSLGLVFFELINDFGTIMEKIEMFDRLKKKEIYTNTIIDKMIDKDPLKRPGITEVKQYLVNYLQKLT